MTLSQLAPEPSTAAECPQPSELPRKIALDKSNAASGLGRLAVAIVNLLHELLERQAIRRMDNGTMTADEIERVGECLMQQSEAIDTLCELFGLTRQDLSIDLGPLGKLV